MTIDPSKIMRDPIKDGPFILDLGQITDSHVTQIPPTASQVILQGLDQKPEQLYIERGTIFPLLRLPNELLQSIFAIVRGDGMFGYTGSERDGYQDIKSLLFSSRALYRLSVLHLYRRITVREPQFASLARTLIANPRLAQETRELGVYFNSQFVPKSRHFKMHPSALEGVPAPRDSKDQAGINTRNNLFIRNLSLLLLRQMCRLEVLDINGTPNRLFEDSSLLLPCLRKLSLSGGYKDSGPYFDECQAERLRRMAPCLEALSLYSTTTNAAILKHAPRTLKNLCIDVDSWLPVGATLVRQMAAAPLIPGAALGITTCTIRADPSMADSPYWVPHMQDILRCCPQVKSLILLLEWEFRCMPCLRTPPGVRRFPVVSYKRLEDVLAPCRATIRSIRVDERAPGELIYLTAESFSDFVNLETLEISSGIVTRGGDAERQRKKGAMKFFLEHLPSSLRCLKIRKHDEEVDSELAAFIETAGSDRLPSFKTLELWTTRRNWPCSARLEAACKQRGIELSYQDTFYFASNPAPRPHPGRTLLTQPSV